MIFCAYPESLSQESRSRPGSNQSANRRLLFAIICLLVVALSTVIQFGCINQDLVIDDLQLVFNTDNGRGCDNNPIACFSGKLFHLYYRPMLTASFAFVQRFHLHDNSSRWFHIENLALHAIVAAMAFWFFRLVLRRRMAALAAGTLFSLHPVQVCVTTFIGGRTDNLALLFLLPFSIGIIKAGKLLRASRRIDGHGVQRRACAVIWIAISVFTFLAAIFTKEQVIPLVLISPLLLNFSAARRRLSSVRTSQDAYPQAPAKQPVPLWLTVFFLPILVYVYATSRVIGHDKLPTVEWSKPLHIEMIGRTLWYFAKTFFAPTVTTLHQSTLGPWDTPQIGVAILGYLCAAAWLGLLLRLWQNRRLRLLALWTSLTTVTCINIIAIPSQFASPYRAAIPLIGLCGLAGFAVDRLPEAFRRRYGNRLDIRPAIGAAVAAALGWFVITTVDDVPKWRNEMSLMQAEVAADPNYVPARASVANNYVTKDKPDYRTSLAEYDICVFQLFGRNTPESDYKQMLSNPIMLRRMQSASGPRYGIWYIEPLMRCRGWDRESLGDDEGAIADYNCALSLVADDPTVKINIANCYHRLANEAMDSRDYQKAIGIYRLALTSNPDDRSIRDALVSAYRIAGDKAKADAIERMEDRFTGQAP